MAAIQNTMMEQDSRFLSPVSAMHHTLLHSPVVINPNKITVSGEALMADIINLKLSDDAVHDDYHNTTNLLCDKLYLIAGALKSITKKLTDEMKARMKLEDKVTKLEALNDNLKDKIYEV